MKTKFAKLREVTDVIFFALGEVKGTGFLEREREGEVEVRAASIAGRVSAPTARLYDSEKQQRAAVVVSAFFFFF